MKPSELAAPRPPNRSSLNSAAPHVTIAIVAFNSGAFLQRCVDSLAQQTFTDFEAVIADNASQDGSVRSLRLPDARFRIESMGGNLGFAVANNRVAAQSNAKWLATLNPDTVTAPDWLERLLAAAGRWPHASAFGSTQIMLEDPGRLDGVGDIWHAAGVAWRARHGRPSHLVPPEGQVFSPCAAAALYLLSDFRDVGGFDETFFCYSEDVDLAYRLRLSGRIAVQVPDAMVLHAGSAISGRTSEFTIFHGHRNRIWTFVKNTPGPLLWLLAPYHLAMNGVLLLLHLRAQRAGPLLRAYWAAARGLPSVWERRREAQLRRTAPMRELTGMMAWSPLAVLRRDVLGGRLPFTRRGIARWEDSDNHSGELD